MSNELIIPFVYAGEVLSGAVILPVVGAGMIAARFYIRIKAKQMLGPDDWFILAAWPLLMGMGICLIYGVSRHAIGYPSPPYPIELPSPLLAELTETTPEQTTVFIVDWAIWMLMIPGNGFIKISAVLLYRRIFVINKGGWLNVLTKIMLAICVLWTISFFFAQLFGCGLNFEAPFGTLEDVASCNTNVRLNGLMISDLITDILVWLLPVVPIWQLRMSIGKKICATGILSLAAISLAAAIVRLIVQLEITNGGYAARTDPNLTLTILLYWSVLESGLALIATCLPTIHVLWIRQAIGSAYGSIRGLLSTQRLRGSASNITGEGHYDRFDRTAYGDESLNCRGTHTRREEFEMGDFHDKASDVESQVPDPTR